MRKVIDWFRSWWGLSGVFRQVSHLHRKIDALKKEKTESDKTLELLAEAVHSIHEDFEEEVIKMESQLGSAALINQKMSDALDAIQEELLIAKEVLIPGLIEANNVLIKRMEAETAIHVMRTVHAQAPKEVV